MTRVVRNAAICVAGILVASAALANVPDPSTSTFSNGTPGGNSTCMLVAGTMTTGTHIGVPDFCEAPTGANPTPRCNPFTVTVKDFANNVIAGSVVQVDFSGCPDISISCDQLNGVTGQTQAAGKKVLVTTNALGQAKFTVQGAGNSNSVGVAGTGITPGTAAGAACATVSADGVTLGTLRIGAPDINGGFVAGNNGVNGADAANVGKEAIATSKVERTDIDQNGSVNGADAAREATWVLDSGAAGTGSNKTGTYCP